MNAAISIGVVSITISVIATIKEILYLVNIMPVEQVFLDDYRKNLKNIAEFIILVIYNSLFVGGTAFLLNTFNIEINYDLTELQFVLIVIILLTVVMCHFECKKRKKKDKKNLIPTISLTVGLLLQETCAVIIMMNISRVVTNSMNIAGILITSIILSCLIVEGFYIFVDIYKRIIGKRHFYFLINEQKHYILKVSDKGYTICGTGKSYDDNEKFKFIKTDEIKEKHEIFIEK